MRSNIPPIAVLLPPSENDSLSVLTVKLSSFIYVVHAGHSIAAATGFLPSRSDGSSSEFVAVEGMAPQERECYNVWKEKGPLSLPIIDWANHRGHTPTSQRPLKKAQRRAEALNRIYGTDKAEPCHYTYFVQTHSPSLPLVKAIARVIGAEKNEAERQTNFRPQSYNYITLQSIVCKSRQILHNADETPMRSEVIAKIQFLEAAMKRMQSAHEDRFNFLGKRKQRDDEDASADELGLFVPRLAG